MPTPDAPESSAARPEPEGGSAAPPPATPRPPRDRLRGGEPPWRRWKRHHKILFWVIAAAGVALLAIIAYGSYVFHLLENSKYASRGWKFPSYVYADWLTLAPAAAVPRERVIAELTALEYRRVSRAPDAPGEMRVTPAGLDVWTRPFRFPDGERDGQGVHVTWAGAQVGAVQTLAGRTAVSELRLEPIKIGELYGAERQQRSYVALAQVPAVLQQAVIASEDRRFYKHGAIDVRGLARAIARDLRARGAVEGGSTLTQQVVKNLFLSQRRSVWRKATEAALAVMMEMRYSKGAILELYLNQIYLGQWGSSSIGGVETASRFYFGKHASDLSLNEAALLAGMIPAPNVYSPHRNPRAAKRRRNAVLRDMLSEGYITAARYRAASREPLDVIPEPPLPRSRAPYFLDYARQTLSGQFSQKALSEQGLRVFTTLDVRLQEMAEARLAVGVEQARRRIAWRNDGTQVDGAFVALEPGVGAIRALVGGSDYGKSQFNRVIDARRQPGSAFKPVIYTAALDTPSRHAPIVLTPSTILEDTPTEFASREGPWRPRNYEGRYMGQTTLRRALYMSLNVATVHLSQMVGLGPIIEYAHRLGIESPMAPVPSLALGVAEVTPLELTNAFATIAAQGVRARPFAVRAVTDMRGKVLMNAEPLTERVVARGPAYVMITLMQDVLNHGTGFPARSEYGFRAPAAGKTGTTNDEVDSWFVGFTPTLVAGVWVGADHGGRLGLTGAQAALPVWAEFMRDAVRGYPAVDFAAPPDIEMATIDADTGLLARSECPRVVRQAFVRGTAPTEYCRAAHYMEMFEDEFFNEFGVDSTAVEETPPDEEQPPAEQRENPDEEPETPDQP